MNDDFDYPLLLMGVGTTGLTVVENLYQREIPTISPVICHADANLLRASPVPGRVYYEADRTDEELMWHLTDSLATIDLPGELVLITTDLGNPTNCRLTALLARILREWDKFVCVIAGSSEQEDLLEESVLKLKREVNTVCLYKQDQLDHQERIEQLTDGVGTLANFLGSLIGNVDFPDVKRVVNGARMTIVRATSMGDKRAEEVIGSLVDQLKAQFVDGPTIQRVLMVMSNSDTKPILLREQVTISTGITDFMEIEAKLFKLGYITDNTLNEWLDVTLLVGIPF